MHWRPVRIIGMQNCQGRRAALQGVRLTLSGEVFNPHPALIQQKLDTNLIGDAILLCINQDTTGFRP